MNCTPNSRTTTALLNGLRDLSDESAWRELTDRCGPILRGVAKRMGVSSTDLDDVVQTTLVVFVESWRRGQYDRARGRLRSYLITILRSRVVDLQRDLARRNDLGGDFALAQLPGVEETEQLWMNERRARILEGAFEQLRRDGVAEQSLQAFELYALRHTDAGEVAAQLCMTRESVYDAKYRLSHRLQVIMARLDEMYEDV